MPDIQVELSDDKIAYIKSLVQSGAFRSIDEYLQFLIQADYERESRQSRIEERAVLDSIERNEYRKVDDAYWQDLTERAAARQKPRASA
jgi:Arc/MetJ-type ribon-helix-helix transcriptional regulator